MWPHPPKIDDEKNILVIPNDKAFNKFKNVVKPFGCLIEDNATWQSRP